MKMLSIGGLILAFFSLSGFTKQMTSPPTTPKSVCNEISGLKATAFNNAVELQWESCTKLNVKGFNVYRFSPYAGDPVMRVNPGQGLIAMGVVSGQKFCDKTAKNGEVYTYEVEALGFTQPGGLWDPKWDEVRQVKPTNSLPPSTCQ